MAAKSFRLDHDRVFQNRNAMLWLYPGATGVKTGFTVGAGYCLLAVAEREGREVLAVVLGDDDEPFSDAAALLDFGIEGFEQRRLVARGQEVDSITVRGRLHPVVAARGATLLVPVGVEVERSIRIRERTTALEVGDRVGTLTYRVPSGPVAVIPLLVGERATEEPDGPPARREDARWALVVAGSMLGGFLLLLVALAVVRRRSERRRAPRATRGWSP